MPRARLHVLALALLLSLTLAGCSMFGGTDPESDDDGDGLSARVETTPRAIVIETSDGSRTIQVTSDPDVADTDGDGLEDFDEMVRKTNPRDADTDGDGLLDGSNVTLDPSSELAVLWRERGILESSEGSGVFLGEFPVCAPARLKPELFSSDRPLSDGLGDGDELRGWSVTLRGESRFVQGDPCTADADSDGANDRLERDMGTDPRDPDTDMDGAIDGYDADPLWNLMIAFGDVETDAANATVTLLFQSGANEARADSGDAKVLLDVNDTSTRRDSFVTDVLVTALDADSGDPVSVFPNGAQAVLTLDLVTGETVAADGASIEDGVLRYVGADGSASFAWATERQ